MGGNHRLKLGGEATAVMKCVSPVTATEDLYRLVWQELHRNGLDLAQVNGPSALHDDVWGGMMAKGTTPIGDQFVGCSFYIQQSEHITGRPGLLLPVGGDGSIFMLH